MKLIAISDTHNLHKQVELPSGDILIHAGDSCLQGTSDELDRFSLWLHDQPHSVKLVIAGNHDWSFQRNKERALRILNPGTDGVVYLEDSQFEYKGIKFWGSPWQPWFFDWAFNVPRGMLKPYWDKIPNDTNVLITHGPPHGILDQANPKYSETVGCSELFDRVDEVQPVYHIFGHIHGSYGKVQFGEGTTFVNASQVDESYRIKNKPWELEI